MTAIFIIIIAICTFYTIMLNSLNAKLSRYETSNREYQSLKNKDSQKEAQETARANRDAALSKYNESIARFPANLAANIFGFKALK